MKKFIIAGLQRTGTTMLVRLISEHENINCQGELFIDRYPNNTPYTYQHYIRLSKRNRLRDIIYKSNSTMHYLDEIFSAPKHLFRNEEMHEKCNAIGFKLMLNHAEKTPSTLNYIKKHNISVIQIIRKNILNVLVSRKVNKVFGIAHTKKKIATPQVEIDTKNLLKIIKKLEDRNDKWGEKLGSVPYLKIYFEDFIQDKTTGLKQITEFLDVPNYPDLEFQTTKLNPTDLRKSITNYDKVKDVLEGTEFEKYL